MGVVYDIWNIGKDIVGNVWNTAKSAAGVLGSLIQKIAPKLFEKLGSIVKRDDGEYVLPLKPINISLVAPSGAGKSSLISTVIWYLNNGGLAKGKGFDVDSCSAADRDQLNKFNANVQATIMSKAKGKIAVNVNDGTADRRKFDFEIKSDIKGEDLAITQPFSIMDIPGGWIKNPPQDKTGYNEFKNHLHESQVLWVPIEAPFFMEAVTNDQNAYAAFHLDIDSVRNFVSEWAQYRKEKNEKCSLFFVPIKCETYFSKGNGESAALVRKRFMEIYKGVIDKTHELCPKCDIFYTPIETIGCIKINDSEWEKLETPTSDGMAAVLKAEYIIVPPNVREIAGAEALTQTIFSYASEIISTTLEESKREKQKELKETLAINIPAKTKLNAEIKTIDELEKNIFAPIKDELARLGKAAANSNYCKMHMGKL